MRGIGLRFRSGSDTGNALRSRTRYLLVLIFAALLSVGVAVPVFAAEVEPGDQSGSEPEATGEPEIQPNIVGGTAVPDGKYKFVAAIRNVSNGGSVYQQQFCGGTLIDSDSVLTAAHCIKETGVSRRELRVTVGITDLRKERQGQSSRVSAVKVHPRYGGNRNRKNDAAVLTLSSPVAGIAPIKIPATDSNALEKPGRSATIAGWGSTVKQSPSNDRPPSYPDRMREAQVPVASDARAKSVYGRSYTPRVMLAAGREGKDTCQGDSGGPIFVRTGNGPFQIGITSFGAGCGARGFPGVYAEANSNSIRGFIIGARR